MGEWVADREARAAEPEMIVPDMVKTFVAYFYRHIREKNVYEILTMYETSFHKLSERYFKASPWPSEKAVAPLVEHDHVFCLLYKEMYYRHLYARLTPTLEQRCESWDNYCALFGVILHGNVNMQLPNIWLWEMVDEFIYQFQSFCQYRGKLSTKSPEELELLKRCDGVWNVLGVLNYLQALIEKSGIVDTLSKERDGEEAFSVNDGYDYSASNVLRLLGYFSMVGLLRVHCLIGDYRSAVKAVEPIDLDKSGMFTKVPGCYITTLYYIGFALMMQSRYCDANRTFNTILLYIQRTKAYHQRTAIYDQVLKKNEQIYALVAVCLSICPASVKFLDEGCAQVLREKYNDKMVKMAAGEVALYDELFSYACPKFITPCPPSFEDPSVNVNQEAFRLQLGLFLEEYPREPLYYSEYRVQPTSFLGGLFGDLRKNSSLRQITSVRHQAVLPTMRSFLKLYTTISLSKLAALLELDEYAVRTTLLSLKHKSRQPCIVAGRNVLDAEWAAATDIDFYIDDDMVHVVDNKVQRQYGDYFATHIMKNERMALEISRIAEVITTEI